MPKDTGGVAPVADRIIENPIINSPYRAPDSHFRFDDDGITNEIVSGRRPGTTSLVMPSSSNLKYLSGGR